MRVTIKTENGQMVVDLEEFFPTSPARTRKLFRLMERGLSDSEKEDVRAYLKARGSKEKIAGERKAEELIIGRSENRLEEVKRERNRLEQTVRAAKARIRTLDQLEKAASAWLREFDYICGGSERR